MMPTDSEPINQLVDIARRCKIYNGARCAAVDDYFLLDLPLFAEGSLPKTARKLFDEAKFGVSRSCLGAEVSHFLPGDVDDIKFRYKTCDIDWHQKRHRRTKGTS